MAHLKDLIERYGFPIRVRKPHWEREKFFTVEAIESYSNGIEEEKIIALGMETIMSYQEKKVLTTIRQYWDGTPFEHKKIIMSPRDKPIKVSTKTYYEANPRENGWVLC